MNSITNSSPPPGGRQGLVKYPVIKDPFGLVGRALSEKGPVEILGPSRKIPTKHSSLSGFVPFQELCRNVWFESSLERDLLLTLKPFDGQIGVLEQPVSLNCKRLGFAKGTYHPDFLVFDRRIGHFSPPVLIEVKYEEDLKKKWSEIRLKLLAGRRFALRQGWRFLLMTDRHLRIVRPLRRIGSREPFIRFDLRDTAHVLTRLFGFAIARGVQ